MNKKPKKGGRMISRSMVLPVTALVLVVALLGFGEEGDKIKPEGKVFFHYLLDLTSIEGQELSDNKHEFNLTRVYVGAKYNISDNFMARVLTDASYNNRLDVFIKYGYLQWKLGAIKSKLLIGLQGTNNWKQPEKAWGYRGIRYSPMESFGSYWGGLKSSYTGILEAAAEALLDTTGGNVPTQTDIDKAAEYSRDASNFSASAATKMGSSADLGIGLKMKPNDISYANLMVRNGIGYKSPENDFYKNVQLRGGCYLLEKALHISAYGEIEPWEGADENDSAKTFMNIQWDFMVSYEMKDLFLLGVDANSKIFKGLNEDVTAMCISVFGNVHIIKKMLKAIARFDMYNTGLNDVTILKDLDAKTNTNMVIAGLDYTPHKNVHIVPNVQLWMPEDSDADKKTELYTHVIFKF
jgi:hypothetical protein